MAETIRVADLIARLLVQSGVSDCFMLTGGGAMHLNDALGANGAAQDLQPPRAGQRHCGGKLCAPVGKPAAVNVTTGPGA
jgi:acetolactate synthase-1/2/3 large subunit